MLSWRPSIQFCDLYIQRKCRTFSPYDNVRCFGYWTCIGRWLNRCVSVHNDVLTCGTPPTSICPGDSKQKEQMTVEEEEGARRRNKEEEPVKKEQGRGAYSLFDNWCYSHDTPSY
ncbi:unnamed protein product [Musa acuminata subsp. burmannicoides]